MKNIAFIYQYNEINNGHSIFDKRINAALEKLYGNNFYSVEYNTQTNDFIGTITTQTIDNENTIVILSHFNTFKIAGWFKKSKIVFINHDLPYYAYLLQKKLSSLVKAVYAWIYIHYYWRSAAFIFFISKEELKKSGIAANRSGYIRAGTRPSGYLKNFSSILPVALFTGNYKWSLKANSLRKAFSSKYNGALQLAAINADDTFRGIASLSGINIAYYDKLPEMEAVRIGVITDNFSSGFKLKSLELIHSGCCIASFSNIRDEFNDIIYADLFIQTIKSLDDLDTVYQQLQQQPDVVQKFKLFYDDICKKFNWDQAALKIRDTLANF